MAKAKTYPTTQFLSLPLSGWALVVHKDSLVNDPPASFSRRVLMRFFNHDSWDFVLPVDKYPFERPAIHLGNGILMSSKLGALKDIDLTELLRCTETSGFLYPFFDLDARAHPGSPSVSCDTHEVQNRTTTSRIILLCLDSETSGAQ